MMIAATILAAGASSRMGCPKTLLLYRGKTFLENIVNTTRAAGITRILVVCNDLHGKGLGNVKVIASPDLAAGPIGSIRAAIREIGEEPFHGLLVWPVDFPHVTLETVVSLVDRFRSSAQAIVVPSYQGRRGHPVLFSRTVFPELLVIPDSAGARGVVRADRERVVEVAVSDPAVLAEINTPAAYRRLLGEGSVLG